MDKKIEKAIEILKNGGIVIFPTDTAFGIGCRIDDENAVKKLFEIRQRPRNKAVPVLISSIDMAREYTKQIPQDVENLMKEYWPGALTIILQCTEVKVPKLVRGGGDTLGVRMPNHVATLNIIKNLGVPLLGPSANFSGAKTPYKFKDLDIDLVKLVDYIVEGECLLKKTSTVIDCTKKPWKILRSGAISVSF